MSNSKISALTSATTPLAGTETLPIVQSSTTKQVSVANLTAGRSVSTGALSVVGANTTLDNAYYLNGKLAAGSAVAMIGRNSSDVVVIDPDGYGAKIGFGGRYSFAGGGDFTNVIGNYIQGTAAKGINFTANTPASGMTSQLLNWYEQGNWTPNQGAGLTVIGTFSSGGRYTRVGRLVTVEFSVAGSTSVAIISDQLLTSNLPFTAGSTLSVGTLRNANNSISQGVQINSTSVYIVGPNIAATTSITVTATYSV